MFFVVPHRGVKGKKKSVQSWKEKEKSNAPQIEGELREKKGEDFISPSFLATFTRTAMRFVLPPRRLKKH